MRRIPFIVPSRVALIVLGLLAGCTQKKPPGAFTPPVARRIPTELTVNGKTRIDNYYWLRDDTRSNPDVMKLIRAENKYTDEVMSRDSKLQDKLFNEIAGRLQDSDNTVPVRDGKYLYYREIRAGHEYPVYVRREDRPGAVPEVVLDVNVLSAGHDYYTIGNWSVTPDNHVVAFAEDTVGRRLYTIRFRDLTTGKILKDHIADAATDLAWANDSKSLFYVHKDPENLWPYEVYMHRLGESASEDRLVYVEKDPAFYTSLYATRTNRYIALTMQSTNSSEVRLIDADRPDKPPRVFLAREPGHEYHIRQVPGWFFIITNWKAENFRLMKTPEDDTSDKSKWQEVVPGRSDVLLSDAEIFSHYIALNESTNGLTHLRVIDRDTGASHTIAFRDPTYTARLYSNPKVDTRKLRYVYSSLTTPESVYEYNMATGHTRLLKQEKVSGGFDPANYASERIFIRARDGTQVPVSLVYRKSLRRPGENPLLVHAYGAYGIPSEASFRARRLSLLDRGFVYAIVHVRGGDEMGQQWYDDGRLLNKRHTFTDFIDATHALIRRGYGGRGKVFADGGSAGGLIMGVIANEAPHLYRGILARVPFVDVVTTMSDPSIPLTSGEFKEWGNPRIPKDYDYMLGYSPYDQVRAQHYPSMFVTAALWDSQVQYYEPLKWVAKLRHFRTGNNLLLLHVDMNTGHNGATGRYDRYRLEAMEYAFLLDVLKRG